MTFHAGKKWERETRKKGNGEGNGDLPFLVGGTYLLPFISTISFAKNFCKAVGLPIGLKLCI